MTARSLGLYTRAPGNGGHGAAALHLFRLIATASWRGLERTSSKLMITEENEPEESGSGRPPACNIRNPLAHTATVQDLVFGAIALATRTPVGNNHWLVSRPRQKTSRPCPALAWTGAWAFV